MKKLVDTILKLTCCYVRQCSYVSMLSIVSLQCLNADTQTYTVAIENLWRSETHGTLPFEAHFSWFGGATHNDQVSFWNLGEIASPGMVEMAETGATFILRDEIREQITSGNAHSEIDQRHWFCPPETNAAQCGPLSFDIEVDSEFPLVTLVSMLGPSPDWFVGVDGLSLRNGDQWINQLEIDLFPYDGGTRSANVYALFGPRTIPPDPITLITTESGQLISPQLLGRMSFTRVIVPEPSGWLLSGSFFVIMPFRRRYWIASQCKRASVLSN